MDQIKICQSCAMPLDKSHSEFIAKEKDGRDSIYCTFCYTDGEFINPDATISDMVEIGVPHLAGKIGEQAAREQLNKLLPTLERWSSAKINFI